MPFLLVGFRIVLAALLFVLAAPAGAADAFLDAGQAFRLEVSRLADGATRLHWSIEPGYYLYRDRMAFVAKPSGTALQVALPPGVRKEDPTFGTTEVYHDGVTVQLSPGDAAAVDVTWQGCAEAGLCYPPQQRTIRLADAGPAGGTQPAAAAAGAGVADVLRGADVGDDRVARLLGERSLGWTLPLFFLFGLALAFTPCMLPMLPIVSGLVVGSRPAPGRALALTLAFVLPMAATYALLGVAAALAGASVQALLQNRWTLLGLAAVYVVLAAGMFGVFTLQLPGWLRDRLDAASRRTRGGSLAGAGAMGVLSALLVGPCMTAPLAGVLLHIAQGGRPLEGALLLFSLGLGSGLPLVLAGTLGARLLPRPGMWMERVKALLGFVLLGTAVWTVQRAVAAPLALLAWGVLLLAAALALAHLAAPSAAARDESAADLHPPLRLAARTLALAAGLWGSAMVLGAAAGRGDPWQPLAFAGGPPAAGAVASAATGRRFEPLAGVAGLEARLAVARERGQVLLVDFYADWCVSCKAIEHEVFGNARVQRALDGMVLLRADVTANDADSRDLMRAYRVIGPPTVMIFDPSGHERRDARLVGEFTAEQLLKRLAAAAAPQS